MASFSLVVPFRTNYYEAFARTLDQAGLLRKCILWTRNPISGIAREKHALNPALGLAAYLGAKTLSAYQSEAFRFALYPLFDRWACSQIAEGENLLASYGHANRCFKHARRTGGKTFLDAGNSHPDTFWEILSEEHRRWKCPLPPVPHFYIHRAKAMMEDVDYVLSPSTFVRNSFLAHGFSPDQILPVVYAQNLDVFKPSNRERPKDRPFTIVNTGALSLRKGTPYLLLAFRQIQKKIPRARLLLSNLISDSIRPLLEEFGDLNITWSPPLPHPELAKHLQNADLFILPSLEEGLVRTALEAMACGLPVILTPNTGANDFVVEGQNGSIVPIRDADAIVDAALYWHSRRDHPVDAPTPWRDSLSEKNAAQLLLQGIGKTAEPTHRVVSRV